MREGPLAEQPADPTPLVLRNLGSQPQYSPAPLPRPQAPQTASTPKCRSHSSPGRSSPSANATEYGLAADVYTRDLDSAFRKIEGLETDIVGLNRGMISNPAAPIGGIKQSGFGREVRFAEIEE